jgi:anti-sigma factor RsiW
MLSLSTKLAKQRDDRDKLLSAFLDGELDESEKQQVQELLASDSSFSAELRALRRTVALVRELPVLPVPRNFILPRRAVRRAASTVGSQRRKVWTAPALTAFTSAVSLLLVLVVVGESLYGRLGGMSQLVPADRAEDVLEAAPREDGIVTTEPMVAQAPIGEEVWTESAETELSEVDSEADLGGAEAPASEEAEETGAGLVRVATPLAEDEVAPIAAEAPAVSVAPVDSVVPTEGGANAVEVTEPSSRGVTDAATATPQTEEKVATVQAEDQQSAARPAATVGPTGSVWRAIEVGLAAITIVLMAATVRAWRARARD